MSTGSKDFDFTFASAASKSLEVAEVAGYEFASLYVPAFATLLGASSAGVKLEGSLTATTSEFRAVKVMGVYSAGSGILEWETPDSTGNFTTDLPVWGQFWIRLALTTAATDGIGSFTVRAYNNR